MVLGVGAYCLLPAKYDAALSIALRARTYFASFEPVEAARREFVAGRFAVAERRLVHFLDEHRRTQPAQLHTHAVTDGHMLLSEVYRSQNRLVRADRELAAAAKRTPLDYYIWYVKGRDAESRGDLAGADKDLERAFLLAPNHRGVAETYLAVLADRNASERILWVADRYERACRRGAPAMDIRAGARRSALQRWVLDEIGIPVEHGRYTRSLDRYGLQRGEGRSIELPPALWRPWIGGAATLYLQLRVQHCYDGFEVDGFTFVKDSGEQERVAADGRVQYLHRAHSGAEFYAEIDTGLNAAEITAITVHYSCPEGGLSEDSVRIVDKARENALVKGGH